MNKAADPMQGFLEQLLRDWESGGAKATPPPPPVAAPVPPARTPASSVVRALQELGEAVALSAQEAPPPPVVSEPPVKPTLSWKPAPPPPAPPAPALPQPAFQWKPAPEPAAVVAEPPKPTLEWKPAPPPPPVVQAPAEPPKLLLEWKSASPAPPVVQPIPQPVAHAAPARVEPTAEQEPAPPPKPVFQWKAVPADPPALPPEPPKPTPPLIDFAAALQALKAARPAAPKAPEPPPAPVELSPPIEEAVVVAAVEAVQAVEPAPQPEPTAVVAEPEPEPEPEPVALQPESEPEAVVVAEPEPEPAPQPEWEEIAAPLPPPGKPAGPELASVVAGLEASLPAANLDFAAAGSQRVELRRHLVFAINSEKFAVNLDNLLEIDNMPTWTGIPGLPQSVRGLINLRGEIVSLLELRAILGLPHPDVPKKGKIFVAATADRQAVSAFAVDEIEGIFGFDEARINPLPSLTSGSSITATVEDEGRLVRIVDIGAVLADVEKTFSLDQVWL